MTSSKQKKTKQSGSHYGNTPSPLDYAAALSSTSTPDTQLNSFAILESNTNSSQQSSTDHGSITDLNPSFPTTTKSSLAGSMNTTTAIQLDLNNTIDSPAPALENINRSALNDIDRRFSNMLELFQLQQAQSAQSHQKQDIYFQKLSKSNHLIMNSIVSQNNVICKFIDTSVQNDPHSKVLPPTHVQSDTSPCSQPQTSATSLSVPDQHKPHDTTPPDHHSSFIPPHKSSTKSDPDPSLASSNNIFGSNEFVLACASKVKFSEIENTLKTKKLENDSVEKLEKFYSCIIRSICDDPLL
jgi:hypothetical protein